MKKGEKRRLEIIEKTAEYILQNGIQNASLRKLAEAADTSDRMLLHYFQDKEELMTVVLSFISNRLIQMLDQTEMQKASFSNLVHYLYKIMKDPEVGPIMKLWLEIIAIASKKEDPYYSVAKNICGGFYEFYLQVLKVDEADKEQTAALALVIVEGIALLEGIGEDKKIEKAIQALSALGSL